MILQSGITLLYRISWKHRGAFDRQIDGAHWRGAAVYVSLSSWTSPCRGARDAFVRAKMFGRSRDQGLVAQLVRARA